MKQKLIFTNHVGKAIDDFVAAADYSSLFIIADVNTAQYVLPSLQPTSKALQKAALITVKSGDVNKTIDNAKTVWLELSRNGATRRSLVINLGGGVVTDLGGFAASTYMRGIDYLNVPTTLLAAVDASVGGKTGVNFNGLKNLIGTFTEPAASIISTAFFATLPHEQILSGYGEMLKHALLDSRKALNELIDPALPDNAPLDCTPSLALLEKSVKIKASIVEDDFREAGLRKALNLGHTVGHAFEEFTLAKHDPIPHGFAVAHGCLVALVISHLKLKFPSDTLHRFADFVKANYGIVDIECTDYPELLRLMAHDKKNDACDSDHLAFTLLADVGKVKINVLVTPDEVKTALDIYRDLIDI